MDGSNSNLLNEKGGVLLCCLSLNFVGMAAVLGMLTGALQEQQKMKLVVNNTNTECMVCSGDLSNTFSLAAAQAVVDPIIDTFKDERQYSLLQESLLDKMKWKQVHFYIAQPWPLGKKGQLHSQCGQEWLVASMLGCKRDGFFIDLAANDAMVISSSLTLERDFGWRGICIEANRQYIYGLARRKCTVVLGAAGMPQDQNMEFVLSRGVGGGFVGDAFDNKEKGGSETVVMRTFSLEKLLEQSAAPNQIDFFSLDVEGAESFVMAGFNWERFRFSILTIERPKADLQAALDWAGYVMVRENSNWGDYTYVDSRLPQFSELKAKWANGGSGQLPESCMAGLGYPQPLGTAWHVPPQDLPPGAFTQESLKP
jgi:hypothetical protein